MQRAQPHGAAARCRSPSPSARAARGGSPVPDCLTPPNGALNAAPTVGRLTRTIPAWISAAKRWAAASVARADRRRQPVLDGVGRGDRLVERSRPARTRSPGRTPPRGASAVPGSTSTSTVGGKKQPSREVAVVEPAHRRTRRWRRRRSAVGDGRAPSPRRRASSISGPIVTPSRSPGPSDVARRPARRPRRRSSSWTASLDEDPAGAGARLPGQREADERATTVGGGVEVGVGEHDDRVLAAELELQRAGRGRSRRGSCDRRRSIR